MRRYGRKACTCCTTSSPHCSIAFSHYHSIILFYMKTIGLCSDHAGFELKEYVRGWLEAKGWPYKDYGTYSTESCDYPENIISML